MQLIYLFIIAILNSIDNIGVGAAYSIADIKVKLSKNLLIAFLAFAVSYLACLCGQLIFYYFSHNECSIINMLLLVLMGTKMIYSSFSNEKNDSHNNIKELKYKESISIGIALALFLISYNFKFFYFIFLIKIYISLITSYS
ncbi:manganese efflux pump MntP [Clostridium saccharobutylicum]|uniref:Manganese efflux pump MntP n=1 Tax=Clostridium saccharobutylicum TaxID=169679 RepID=A0A1S8MTB6_CLOSA|nr:manganese efflux pump MntP [Clostridium saccharobutylicum]